MLLGSAVATTPGFAALVASYDRVQFDNVAITQATGSTTIAVTTASVVDAAPVSACVATPSAGQTVVGIGCGEAAADDGSKWSIHGGDGGIGPISLRSDRTLCLEPKVQQHQQIWIIRNAFLKLYAITRALCDMLYLVVVLIGC